MIFQFPYARSMLHIKKFFLPVGNRMTAIMDKIFETNSSFHVKIQCESALRESLISIFRLFFASIDKIFILGVRLGTTL